jgi:hypothetical protein
VKDWEEEKDKGGRKFMAFISGSHLPLGETRRILMM